MKKINLLFFLMLLINACSSIESNNVERVELNYWKSEGTKPKGEILQDKNKLQMFVNAVNNSEEIEKEKIIKTEPILSFSLDLREGESENYHLWITMNNEGYIQRLYPESNGTFKLDNKSVKELKSFIEEKENAYLIPSSIEFETQNMLQEPGIEGYVVKKEGHRILVVDPVPKDYSSTGGTSEFHNAIWFSNAPFDLQVGQRVKVWFDFVAESYPGQSEVKNIEVISKYQPEKAELEESEAIQKALTSKDINKYEVQIIISTEYEEKSDIWNIEMKQGEETVDIIVED
ncbi:YobA family protein [Bacillus suaedaesalsae]|uniref:YobA family protein n=1 Tax=Bacillus suaedaesalsae TaxID=2810349 RepID=A0ABS2DD75_9BACI|nr:YobA family protein [Bacillus suaedaesalsae]MBM6616416.1 YobA family protein [Bacillus suaedaesalsae]